MQDFYVSWSILTFSSITGALNQLVQMEIQEVLKHQTWWCVQVLVRSLRVWNSTLVFKGTVHYFLSSELHCIAVQKETCIYRVCINYFTVWLCAHAVKLSPAGEVPVPMFAAYGASKAALAVFSKVMRLELSAWGVQVALIQPAGFRTSTFNCWSHDLIERGRNQSDEPRHVDSFQ